MTKAILIASGYCDAAVKGSVSIERIMSHLEFMFDHDDEPCLLTKGDHHEIWLVYDDSRPSELIFKLPKGYK